MRQYLAILLLSILAYSAWADQNASTDNPAVNSDQQLTFSGKTLSYADALPLLTASLRDENIDIRIEASTALQQYGEKLHGTKALEELISLVQQREDFSPIDRKISAGLKEPAISEVTFTKDEERLLKIATLHSKALTAGVLSGDSHAVQVMNSLLASKSLTERDIAKEAKEYYDQGDGGAWQQGKLPPRTAQARFTVGTKEVKGAEFRRLALDALQTKDRARFKKIFRALAQGAYSNLLSDRSGIEILTRLLKETEGLVKSDSELKHLRSDAMRGAAMFIEQSSSEKRGNAREFLDAAARDSDEDIAKYGAAVLNLPRQ